MECLTRAPWDACLHGVALEALTGVGATGILAGAGNADGNISGTLINICKENIKHVYMTTTCWRYHYQLRIRIITKYSHMNMFGAKM